MLSRAVLKMVASFFTFILAGMFLGNLIFIYVGLIPLLLMALALIPEQPGGVEVKRMEEELSAWVDETVTISVQVKATTGLGVITVADTLPPNFELVEGNNFRVFWKGLREKTETFSYTVRCTKRGIYWLNSLKWESRHLFNLKQTRINVNTDPLRLVVKHRPLNIRRIRSLKTLSKIPLPLGSSAKLGITTTDFREIRDYSPGDPYRHINWKATSKRVAPYGSPPQVNEFEREGKKVVWIFLDSSSIMALGSTIQNSFEYAVQAVTGLAQFYLNRDCRVGLYVYNDAGRTLLPDVGKRQQYKVMKETLNIEVETVEMVTGETLKSAVQKCRGHLLGSNPLSIIVTMITPKNVRHIIEGVKELRKYSPQTRVGIQPILVIHIKGYNVAAEDLSEEFAADLLEMRNQPIIREMRRAGASVIPWNPLRQSFTNLMLLGMKAR